MLCGSAVRHVCGMLMSSIKQTLLSGISNGSFNSNLKSVFELESRVLNIESTYAFLILHFATYIFKNIKTIL